MFLYQECVFNGIKLHSVLSDLLDFHISATNYEGLAQFSTGVSKHLSVGPWQCLRPICLALCHRDICSFIGVKIQKLLYTNQILLSHICHMYQLMLIVAITRYIYELGSPYLLRYIASSPYFIKCLCVFFLIYI